MKKLFLIFVAAVVLSSCATTEKPGDIVEKEVTANGEKSLRKLKYRTLTEYDENGNEIHCHLEKNHETWREYDAYGNETHYKNVYKNGGTKEYWFEYDERGNEIHFKSNDGNEWWSEYNENGKEIHKRNNDGGEEWTEYDTHGNISHITKSDKEETWFAYEYDSMGNKTYQAQGEYDELKEWHTLEENWFEYDSAGRLVHFKNSGGQEQRYEYDASGNNTYAYEMGYETWIDYDEAGRKIHLKANWTSETWYEYDTDGNLIYERTSEKELFYEYDFHPNGKIKTEREYTSEL